MMRTLPLLLFTAALATAQTRSWTDALGRTVEAELADIKGTTVTLRLPNGKEVPYPIEKLSAADREYVEQQRASFSDKGKTASLPRNFSDPWPERVSFGDDPQIEVVEENAAEKRFTYESANYRYNSDVRLAKSVVKGFAVMFESTYLYCRTLPLALQGGTRIEGKLQIFLFEKFEDYVKAGGPPSSAGVFLGSRGVVLTPLTSLGVRAVGSGYMLDRDKSSSTLPHELTHQLTPDEYFSLGSVGWFIEGIAEYVATTPYRAGSYNVRSNLKPIMEYVTAYGSKDLGGRALGTNVHMPHLKTFLLQDYPTFQENPKLNYGCALLLTTYFLNLDGKGDGARVKAFLNALLDGKTGEEALAFLLDGRSYEQVQDEIIKAWGRRGVDFSFDPAPL